MSDDTNVIPEGLSLDLEFLTPEEELNLIKYLDSQSWSTALSRRTQHYGYVYDYSGRKKVKSMPAPVISGPLADIATRIEDKQLMKPVQCIVNEYYRNQGINGHIDSSQFGPRIITISLNADTVMVFTRGTERYECFLPRRSIALLEGPARYEYKHCIEKKVTYWNPFLQQNVTKPQNYRRISITYRELVTDK